MLQAVQHPLSTPTLAPLKKSNNKNYEVKIKNKTKKDNFEIIKFKHKVFFGGGRFVSGRCASVEQEGVGLLATLARTTLAFPNTFVIRAKRSKKGVRALRKRFVRRTPSSFTLATLSHPWPG